MSGWGHFVADGKPGLVAPVEAYQVGGTDGTNLRALLTDTLGRLIIVGSGGGGTFSVQDVADGTPGAPPPALAIQTAGTDGTDLRALLTDATGKLQVVLPAVSGVLGSPIPGSVVMLGLQNSSANVASVGADNNGSSPIANRLPTIAAWDGTDSRLLLTDSSGRLYVNVNGTVPVSIAGTVNTKDAADGTPGSAVPTTAIQVAGSDGTNLRALLTDATGQLKVLLEGGTLPGPATPSNSNSAGNVSSLHVKSSAGTFYGLTGYSSIQQYLQLLDANSLSSGTTAPVVVLQVGPGSFAFDYQPSGRSFATGIFAAFSSTETVFTTGTAGWLDCQFT